VCSSLFSSSLPLGHGRQSLVLYLRDTILVAITSPLHLLSRTCLTLARNFISLVMIMDEPELLTLPAPRACQQKHSTDTNFALKPSWKSGSREGTYHHQLFLLDSEQLGTGREVPHVYQMNPICSETGWVSAIPFVVQPKIKNRAYASSISTRQPSVSKQPDSVVGVLSA